MKRWRTKLLFLGGAAAAAFAIPALSREAPEQLLPPGFNNNAPPPPQQAPADQPQPAQPGAAPALPVAPSPLAVSSSSLENFTEADLEALEGYEPPRPEDMPPSARRSPDIVGPLDPEHWGLAADAWGGSHGVFLSTLMRRLDAPMPSRWESILLRRALLSRVPTPYGVNPADWIAERAWLLLRMGEADGARMLVQAVDVDDYTPKMFAVAVQTALATADPAALCPLVARGKQVSDEPVWPLADAMCAALEGEASRASALIDQARRQTGAGGIDLLLAEKIVGAGENTRRAVTIEWDPVDSLNSWRFGLASATGLVIPDRLMRTAAPQMWAWQARAPMVPLEQRLAASDVAASLGVFSNGSLVDIYSQIADTTDPSELTDSVAARLRAAYVGSTDDRMAALRQLWEAADGPTQRNARWVLTASAARLIPPSQGLSDDVPNLLSAMLSAGLDRHAAAWAGVVSRMDGSAGDRAWALLALASPRVSVEVNSGRVSRFVDDDDSREQLRSKLLLASLVGMGRLSESAGAGIARTLGMQFDRRNRWTVMIDRAADRRQPGTVALLAAIGMQTADWRGVPPEYMYHIVRDLRLVGREYEARMIAAEALSRS